MVFDNPISVQALSELLGCNFIGDASIKALGINEIHRVVNGDISFVDHPKYYDTCLNSAATVIIIDKEVSCPEGKALLISKAPADDFNKINRIYQPFVAAKTMISPTATIGEDTIVQPDVFIGHHVKIGKNCLIQTGARILNGSEIGDDVIIGANTVIGSDAFYYKKKEDGYHKFHSAGKVVIENKVELGANCTIDKGLTDVTFIGEGSKLDNTIHIGHDTRIGKNVLMAAQVGVAGCCDIEDNVILWGQVGISSSLRIGENAIVLAKTGVTKNLEPNKTYFGIPAGEMREQYRSMAFQRKLYKESIKK